MVKSSAELIEFARIHFLRRKWFIEEREMGFYVMKDLDGGIATIDSRRSE
jgi:hypothetical protein